MTLNLKKVLTLSIASTGLLFSSAQAQAMPSMSPEIMNYGMIALIFLVMYFLVIRPQSKKAKLHQQMLTALRRGDQVLTAGGIIGIVQKIDNEQEIHVEISKGIQVRIAKATIVQVLAKTEPLKTAIADIDTNDIADLSEVDIKPAKTTAPRAASKASSQSRKRITKSTPNKPK